MDGVAYSTGDVVAVVAYLDVLAADQEYSRRLIADLTELGADPKQVFITSWAAGKPVLDRLHPLGDVVPEGWRLVHGALEPRRGRPGEAARQWLADHQPVDVRGVLAEHGLPRAVWIPGSSGRRICAPEVFVHEDTLWAHYPAAPGQGHSAFDRDRCTWRQRKLSEFYAAKEALEEARR